MRIPLLYVCQTIAVLLRCNCTAALAKTVPEASNTVALCMVPNLLPLLLPLHMSQVPFALLATAYRRKRIMEGLISGDKDVMAQVS